MCASRCSVLTVVFVMAIAAQGRAETSGSGRTLEVTNLQRIRTTLQEQTIRQSSPLELASLRPAKLIAQDPAAGVQDKAAQGSRKRNLTIGVIGVGIAVTGLLLYSADDSPQLPGITSTQKTIGLGLIAGGATVGSIGLWRALR